MKLTKSKLKQIIKEEIEAIYSEELTTKDKKKKKKLESELDDLKHK